ncbi:uncharacterized protein LOC118440939 [Vespa mandarinia]|uniref:uncharacterized protein LOC118440939 n=1 Tax=Vespa mandarinia TaxID=7446 RepID=UPI001618438D|nr:uncharacterized protein LOC118440939 [Vespa mandarinia]
MSHRQIISNVYIISTFLAILIDTKRILNDKSMNNSVKRIGSGTASQWPYQSFRTKCTSLALLFILGATQIVAKFCAIFTSLDDINVILGNLVKTILNQIETDYSFFTTNCEKEIISKYAENGRKFTIYCTVTFTMAMLHLMIAPLKGIFGRVNNTSKRPMLHHVEYFHNCGLFKTLGYRLSHLIDEKVLDNDVLNPSKSGDKYYKDISLYALRHQKAIEFAELLDSFYSALIHVYFECMNGQRLINHSSEMHEHLINTEWYCTSLRTRKVTTLMTLRSLKPSILTAAGILNISLKTFCSIVRTSISYFTVMRSFQ